MVGYWLFHWGLRGLSKICASVVLVLESALKWGFLSFDSGVAHAGLSFLLNGSQVSLPIHRTRPAMIA